MSALIVTLRNYAKSVPQSVFVGTLILIGTVIRLPQLNNSLAEAYAFRQTQTAMVAREFAREGINVFTTPLPVFGANADVPMEMPLFQAVVGAIARLGLDVDVASRLVSLASFQVAALLLFVMVRRWHNRTSAFIALALFQFTPFGLHWGAASLIDFFSVALALGMVSGIDQWIRSGSAWSLAAGSVSAVAAFLAKATTAPSWGLLLLLMTLLVMREMGIRNTWRRVVVGYVGPVIGFASAVVWTRFADSIKEGQTQTEFLTSDSLTDWNFGTVAQRLTWDNYFTVLERIGAEIVSVGVLAVVLAVVGLTAERKFADLWKLGSWIVVAFSGPVVFFNLYVVHDYYLIAIYPALVVTVAVGLDYIIASLRGLTDTARVMMAIAATATVVVSGLVFPSGRGAVNNFLYSMSTPALAQIMAEESASDEAWIMIGCDWDPTFLYYADRDGVMFRGPDANGFWEEDESGLYTKLVVCSGEPDLSQYLPEGATATLIDGHSVLYDVEFASS